MSFHNRQWPQLQHPHYCHCLRSSEPTTAAINFLTYDSAGLLSSPTTSTLPISVSHLSSIADQTLAAMLTPTSPTDQHLLQQQQQQQQQLHGAVTSSESAAILSMQKRLFHSAFPDFSDEIADEDGCTDDNMSQPDEKKCRRLTSEQVRALEHAFQAENKLEPDRKLQLANVLGLQPRQVAIWFQNRRARWKTKQIERDYASLKEKFESMKAHRDALLKEKEKLQAEIARLKQDLENEGLASDLEALQTLYHPPSYFEASSIKESINLISPACSKQKANDAATNSDESDGNDITEVADSPQPVERSVCLISKSFIGAGSEPLPNSAAHLDVADFVHGRGKSTNFAQKLTIRNGGAGLFYDDGNGGWVLPFDWWECNS